MPNITAAGEYDQKTPGFSFLGQRGQEVGLIFSGSTLPTTLEVGTRNDEGDFVAYPAGTVTALPAELLISAINNEGIVINVVGGSPNFNLSYAGAGRNIG